MKASWVGSPFIRVQGCLLYTRFKFLEMRESNVRTLAGVVPTCFKHWTMVHAMENLSHAWNEIFQDDPPSHQVFLS